MKTRKYHPWVLVIVLTSLFGMHASASCYGNWLTAFEYATTIYETDSHKCDYVIGSSLCHYENELRYDMAINTAANNFCCCAAAPCCE